MVKRNLMGALPCTLSDFSHSVHPEGPKSGVSACPVFQNSTGPGWYLREEGVLFTSGEAMTRGKPLRQNLVCVRTKVVYRDTLSMPAASGEPTSKPSVGQGAKESWKTSRTVLGS